MISATDRLSTLELINEAKANGASLSKACKEMGIDERTYFRWTKKLKLTGIIDDLRPTALRPLHRGKARTGLRADQSPILPHRLFSGEPA